MAVAACFGDFVVVAVETVVAVVVENSCGSYFDFFVAEEFG